MRQTTTPLGNMTYPRNPYFTGRDALFAELHRGLQSGRPVVLTQGVAGLGGVGKTQTAVEYTYRHASDYGVVLWVQAEEPAALAAGFAGLARLLGLPATGSQAEAVAAVQSWLAHARGWLLVFDDAYSPDELRRFLPQGHGGHVLITSRNPHWAGLATTIPLAGLTQPESVAFLQRRTGHADENTVAALAQLLGDFPLALEMAGATIAAAGLGLNDYLTALKRYLKELECRVQPFTDYPIQAAAAWEIAVLQVRKASPAAADLLNLLAFMAPDEIPLEALREQAAQLPRTMAAALTAPDSVAALRRYGLIAPGGESLSVHRVVQALTRDKLGKESGRIWVEAALRLLSTAERPDLLPHALAVAGHATVYKVAAEPTARLWQQTGLLLADRSDWVQARHALDRALALTKAAHGPKNPKLGGIYHALGRVLHGLGDLSGAKLHGEIALSLAEAAFGQNHPEAAVVAGSLGAVLEAQGDTAGARQRYGRAVAILERAYGPGHPGLEPYRQGLERLST